MLDRRPTPAWLLDLHRFLGTLTVIHVGAIVIDNFVEFTLVEVLVPFTSDVDRTAVALGVISLYLLVIVQLSSWLRGSLAAALWRRLHPLSAPLFFGVGAHASGLAPTSPTR